MAVLFEYLFIYFVYVNLSLAQVAEMLRIISLTKDPVCLARFLQDEVLPRSVFGIFLSSPELIKG